MKEYLFSIAVASVVGGIASLLAKSGTYEKYVRFVAALICVIIILSPFVSLKKIDLSPVYDTVSQAANDAEQDAVSAVTETASPAIAAYIEQSVYQKFGIKVYSADISLCDDGSGRIVLGLRDSEKADEVCAFVGELTGIETAWVTE